MIKIGSPSITTLEKKYLHEAIEKGDIAMGDFISRFEQAWAKKNNREYGVSCNSGTSAIHLALLALGIGEGDEVLVPEFTMAACPFGVSNVGATPVFVDCLDDLTMDVRKMRVTKNTKAILIVPIYGRPCGQEVYDFARTHNLFIIEDFAEAHGIKPKGDITCYSFQANKIISTGEGGMCITNDKGIAEEIRKLSSLYFNKERNMLHEKVAHNFRMTNLQAAIGLAQCERFEELRDKRIQIAERYDKYLPEKYKMPKREVVWVYDIQTDNQEEVKSLLESKGIESRYGFKPMSMLTPYSGEYKDLNAYKWSKRVLYLPTYYELTEEQVKYISQCLI